MLQSIDKSTKISSKDLIETGSFEGLLEGVFFGIEKINATYYIKIMRKILNNKPINVVEYKNFVDILKDEEVLDLLEKYSHSLDIDMILESFDIDNIVALVKDETTKSLVTTLELEWEIWFRFQMRRRVGGDLKTESYIVGLDEAWNRIIYEILYTKNDWEKLLRCGMRNNDWNIIKMGFLDENGKNLYGWVSWFWLSPKVDEKNGKQYLRVRKTKDDDVKMVDRDGKELVND